MTENQSLNTLNKEDAADLSDLPINKPSRELTKDEILLLQDGLRTCFYRAVGAGSVSLVLTFFSTRNFFKTKVKKPLLQSIFLLSVTVFGSGLGFLSGYNRMVSKIASSNTLLGNDTRRLLPSYIEEKQKNDSNSTTS